ncbi:hypothetical protein [Helicobacter felis]|uniref:hypothetical protein n=1 Tax=Helicobacter felis TaxID=214 RepID=UPI001F257F56|nr:hypothetical protein [Helicobacter felis]
MRKGNYIEIVQRYQHNIKRIEARVQQYLETQLKSYTYLRLDTLKGTDITLNLDFQVFINRNTDLATTNLYYVFRGVLRRFVAYKVQKLLEKFHNKLLMRKLKLMTFGSSKLAHSLFNSSSIGYSKLSSLSKLLLKIHFSSLTSLKRAQKTTIQTPHKPLKIKNSVFSSIQAHRAQL